MKTIIGILTILVFAFGAYFYFEKTFAHADDMMKAMDIIKKVGTRLDYKIAEDQLREIQRKIWTIEDRYCPDKSRLCDEEKMPQTVREQYRELKLEKEKLQNELKDLSKVKK